MSNRKQMFLLFLAVFIDLVGFGIVIPILPFVAEKFGADSFTLGLFVASFSLMQFIFSPFWGMLSDKIGRRPVMLIGIAGTAISFFIFGLADSLLVLFISRVMQGIFTSASLPTAQAYIADITEPKDRAKYFGYLGMAFGLGFALGPALGGFLSGNGILFPALIAGCFSSINFIGALLWLPEPKREKKEVARRGFIDLDTLKDALSHPAIGSLILTFAVVSFAFSSLETTYALFGQQRAGLDAENVGAIFTMIGLIMVVVQGWFVGVLARRIGEKKTLMLGLVFSAAAYALISVSFGYLMLVAATALLATGFSLIFPTVNALISINSSSEEQGEAIGLNQGMASLARVVGPLVAGALFEESIAWPFYLSAFVAVVALIIAYFRIKKVESNGARPVAR